MRDLLNNSTVKTLLTALARTASADGSAVDLKGKGRKFLVIFDIGAATGTLDLKIQSSPVSDFASGVVDEAVFSQKTTVGTSEVQVIPTQRYIRASATIGGATPTFTFSVEAIIFLEREIPSGI